MSKITPMPVVIPRQPYDSRYPKGYMESLNDWYHANEDAVEWFLENAVAIRKLLEGKTP